VDRPREAALGAYVRWASLYRLAPTLALPKGLLMARHKLTAEQAFQVLARMSMKTNRKLSEVADELVRPGRTSPAVSPPGTEELTRPGVPTSRPGSGALGD
jgi:hypothetical protein